MRMQERFEEMLAAVRSRRPVIHCITNYVTANDVANMLLAAGASPVMADGVRDAEEMAAASDGMVLNLGTLKEATVEAMLAAGKRATALGHPIVLDPVGAGASAFRRETAVRILREVRCLVVRGNASEIRALAQAWEAAPAAETEPEAMAGREGVAAAADRCLTAGRVPARGVDADERADLNADNVQQTAALLRRFSRRTGAVVMMTGAIDLVADAAQVWLVKNGDPMMKRITGSGCMLDGVTAAFLAAAAQEGEASATPGAGAPTPGQSVMPGQSVTPEQPGEPGQRPSPWLVPAVAAAAVYGVCGELAQERTARAGGGTATFRTHLIDAMSLLDVGTAAARIRAEQLLPEEVQKSGV